MHKLSGQSAGFIVTLKPVINLRGFDWQKKETHMPISTSRVPPCFPQVTLHEWSEGETQSLDDAKRTSPVEHRLFTCPHTHRHFLHFKMLQTQVLLFVASHRSWVSNTLRLWGVTHNTIKQKQKLWKTTK